MHRTRSPGSIFRSTLATLLLLAMLAGQWTGLEHRVLHAGLGSSLDHLVPGAAGTADGADEGYAHSCQLFDAATLAAGIHSGFVSATCERAARDWRLPWPPRSWQAAFSGHFSSRAPPFD